MDQSASLTQSIQWTDVLTKFPTHRFTHRGTSNIPTVGSAIRTADAIDFGYNWLRRRITPTAPPALPWMPEFKLSISGVHLPC